MRNMIKRPLIALIPAAAVAGALLGVAGPASADSTAACQTNPNCFEPVFAISQQGGSVADFTPADDAALTVMPAPGQPVQAGTVVGTRIRNNIRGGLQDWSFTVVEAVPASGAGDYGFTNFDNNHYAGRAVIQAQWTPRGDDSANLCLNISRTNHANLANCDARKGEAFILTSTVPGINPISAPNYREALNVRQTATLARHNALTADDSGFGPVFDARPFQHDLGQADAQMVSALP